MSIALSGLTRRYGRLSAVDDLGVEVPGGAFFVVLGPSGCGKSTLLRLVAGLEVADAGTIALEGRAVAGPGLHVPPEARGVGVVFQSYALWPHLDVRGNVAFPLEARGMAPRAARAAAEPHLRTVALEALADRRPADLSGGQRQRVALARCLAGGARTVLMDEPLANLDPHLRAVMEDEIAAFHTKAGATTLYITHDQREAMALADRVAVMREGRFEQVASPQDIHDRPATAFVAGFVGRGAVLPAEVVKAAAGRAQVMLAPGRMVEVAAPGDARAGPGQLLLRPADLALAGAGGAEPGIPARVRQVRFRGDHSEVEAVLDGLPDTPVLLTLPHRPVVGEALALAVRGGWLLPR